ncbi:hypothetical protein LINPERPRIM_LOCUS35745 [Linum perenne]
MIKRVVGDSESQILIVIEGGRFHLDRRWKKTLTSRRRRPSTAESQSLLNRNSPTMTLTLFCAVLTPSLGPIATSSHGRHRRWLNLFGDYGGVVTVLSIFDLTINPNNLGLTCLVWLIMLSNQFSDLGLVRSNQGTFFVI